MRGFSILRIALGSGAALLAVAGTAPADTTSTCTTSFPSTFAAIQTVIFQNRHCTDAGCHDASAQGGLNLLPDVAYDNLVNQPVQTVTTNSPEGPWLRVFPGQRDRSLLFQNVAALTEPNLYTAPLRPMPQGGWPALSANELEALRLWIENGASRDATVAGTADLLDACLPPAEPIKIDPLPPPDPSQGVQIHMPQWIVKAKSEHEVCYASYYDISNQVPPEYLNDDGTMVKMAFNKTEIRQDPLSHHLIVNLYNGTTPITDPAWGTFKCRGGATDGQPCDPTVANACGDGSGCSNDPIYSVGCFGLGVHIPKDAAVGVAASGFTGTQKAATTITYAPGVYNEMPVKGIFIWDSHAFNTTTEDGKLEAWLNFYFAPKDQQQFPLKGIFLTTNKPSGQGFEVLFKPDVPAFQAEEVCNIFRAPPNANVFELSSHMHHRGVKWRTWDGEWTCHGGANDGQPCSPQPETAYQVPDLCAGAPCQSIQPPKAGDCNGDLTVSVDELVKGVNIVLGNDALSTCPRLDMAATGKVGISNLIAAVSSALNAGLRDPDASLLYTNYIYNDPLVLDFNPVMFMGGDASVPAERSLTYCALYDNGFSDPTTVKTKSGSPPTPVGQFGLGGPCKVATGCTAGKVGQPCNGDDAACNTEAGNDGKCDACELKGGVTTEDEMFLLLGSYFVNK